MILPRRNPFKVLVVDDSFIIRKLVSEIVVSDKDFALAGQAENGKAALRLVREVRPDLVLLDIEMPDMSGLETLRRLGLRSSCHVIILSSLVGAEDSKERFEALRLGAAATISKPSGAVSLDLKQKRASEVVATMRRVVGLPTLAAEEVGGAPPAPVADIALALRPVLDCCTGGVLLFDRGGTLTQANTTAHALVNGAEKAGARLADIFSDFNSGIAEDIWRVAASGAPIVGAEVDYAQQDGSWAALKLSAQIVKVADSDRLIVTLDDISRERHLQDLLAKTQSGGIAQWMAKGKDFARSGGLSHVSILFSDIRDFTPLSEQLGGEGTVAMLNEYFSFMADVIRDCGGQIDKYIGDAIMAVFGAPVPGHRDADEAIAAARGMFGALDLFNERRTESQDPPIRIGLGVATGPVVAGAIGSPDRMNYTVIGDAANLAARLEALTKPYGAAILVCGETVAALTKPTPMRQVDLLRVKGQEAPTAVYEIFVHEEASGDPAGRQAFDTAFGLYRKGDFAEAVAAFDEALRLVPNDRMSALLRQRCLHPPDPSGWDGCWSASDK